MYYKFDMQCLHVDIQKKRAIYFIMFQGKNYLIKFSRRTSVKSSYSNPFLKIQNDVFLSKYIRELGQNTFLSFVQNSRLIKNETCLQNTQRFIVCFFVYAFSVIHSTVGSTFAAKNMLVPLCPSRVQLQRVTI